MTDTDLEDIINSMSIVKPAGYDQLRPRDIKVNYNNFKHVLLAVINGILETGIIPDNVKVAIVRPIYKKGGKKELGSYRPITLMSVISQIIEKFVLKIMTSFCDKYSLISNTKYGFWQQLSTMLLLEDMTDYMNEKIDSNNVVLAILLHLTKAFDTIGHSTLLHKFENLGFRGHFLDFFLITFPTGRNE